jgi:MFS family permease
MAQNQQNQVEISTYCTVHPTTETSLRCNKCNRYMCVKCAVSTSVGYRCRECVRGHDNQFFKNTSTDTWVISAVAAVSGAILGFLYAQINLGLFIAVVLGFPAGGLVSEIMLRASGKRRGRYFGEIGAGALMAGGFIGLIIQIWLSLAPLMQLYESADQPFHLWEYIQLMLTLRWDVFVFLGIVAFAIYARFRSKRVG